MLTPPNIGLCLLSDLSCRVWDRQVRSCLEGSLFNPTRIWRSAPAVPGPTATTKQPARDNHDDITSRGNRPAPRDGGDHGRKLCQEPRL